MNTTHLKRALLSTVVEVQNVGGAGGGGAPGAAGDQPGVAGPGSTGGGAGGALPLPHHPGANAQPVDEGLLHLLLGGMSGQQEGVSAGPPGVVRARLSASAQLPSISGSVLVETVRFLRLKLSTDPPTWGCCPGMLSLELQ